MMQPIEFNKLIHETIRNYKLKIMHHQLEQLLDKLPFEVKEILENYISAAPYLTKSALILPGLMYLKLDTNNLLTNGFPKRGDVHVTKTTEN